MLSGFASHERDVIRERSVAGTNRVAQSGAWMGGVVPFGYRKVGTRSDARLIVSEDKIPGTGAVLFGDKGMIVHGSHGAGGCYLTPEKLMDEYSGKKAPPRRIPRVKNHHWDWLEAIRTGRKAGASSGRMPTAWQ